ncbi:MAG: AAA family ATPase [Paraclostridium sp.]
MKRFNTTGICIPKKHYMVNIENKLNEIEKMIDRGDYFIINRPRQYGKTTTMYLLSKKLEDKYLIIKISFEGIGDDIFKDEQVFSNEIMNIFADSLEFTDEEKYEELRNLGKKLNNLKDVSKAITKFIRNNDKEVILLIDEVDKSSNNQLFLSFLGMLRNKFLSAQEEKDYTFKSVILAGVHNVKNLKINLRNEEEKKLNSPWNIAVNFDIDMSFSIEEIKTMIKNYCEYNNVDIDIENISKEIHFFTSGYPFLVSRICQIIDEKFITEKDVLWNSQHVYKAVKQMTLEANTLFESLIKNLENNDELYDLTKRILINSENIIYNPLDPVIGIGLTYGIFKEDSGYIIISNKIFEEIIYNYMISKMRTKVYDMSIYNFKNNFITSDGGLDIGNILLKFQQYMKENYCDIDQNFIEREGRIIFLAFLAPIINGVGFTFKEVQISQEKRLDIVITYNSFKYIIELKIWRGQEYYKDGINQLVNYLDINNLNDGYLVVFNFNKNKEYKKDIMNVNDKNILSVFV